LRIKQQIFLNKFALACPDLTSDSGLQLYRWLLRIPRCWFCNCGAVGVGGPHTTIRLIIIGERADHLPYYSTYGLSAVYNPWNGGYAVGGWAGGETDVILQATTLMKTLTIISWVSVLLLATGTRSISGAPVAPVTVQFVNPANFTDFHVRGRNVNYTAQVFASAVNDELTPIMKRKYPNSNLLLRFTDIDLAGRYSTARNTRIISEGHPARMSFQFLLTDSAGKSLAKGSVRLNDSSSMRSSAHDPRRSQLFYYERRTLNRWLARLSVSR
jgi:hypothetical protein